MPNGSHLDEVERTLELDGVEMVRLLGPQDRLLTTLEKQYPQVDVHVRSNTVTLHGPGEAVEEVVLLINELREMVAHGYNLDEAGVTSSARVIANDPGAHPAQLFGEPILRARGKSIRPKTLGQKEYVDAIADNTIAFGIGPAGTGKTYLAMAMAVRALQRKEVNRIILSRPAIEAGERLGFLPGTLTEKVDPYLRPLYDALGEMMDPEVVAKLLASGTVEVAPLAYMRGRTLNDSFIILDEAQNTTPEQMKMFLTRLGFGSKMVITGDVSQIDLPGAYSGLKVAPNILSGIEDIFFTNLTSADVVRHSLVGLIVDAYTIYDEKQRASTAAAGLTRYDGRR